MNYSKGDVILIPYPFTDLTVKKVRPAVIVSTNNAPYGDIFIVPLTSRIQNLIEGEFVLQSMKETGLNVPTAVKRGCVLIEENLIIKKVGTIGKEDLINLNNALRTWFEL
jgi:mRNA interferase MazF